MSGKFGTQEVQEVVHSAVVVESCVLQAKDILTNGGLLQKVKLIGVAATLLQSVSPLVSLDFQELKNEVLELDAADQAQVVAALQKALQETGQSTVVVSTITDVLDLVRRTYEMVQEWVKKVKEWLHLN
jgi:hypothetical protein